MIGITGLGQAFDYYMMQSEISADEAADLFEQAIANGLDPNNPELQQLIENSSGMDFSDMFEYDRERINRRVSAASGSSFNVFR